MNRRIAPVAVAVVLALVGTFAVYNYAHHADQRAISKTRSASVLVAQKNVPAGTNWGDVLKGNYLKEEKVPVDSAPTDAIANLAASIPVEQVATADIAAGQIVLRPVFGEKTATTGLLAIPAGKLAITVSIASNADVAGFVQRDSEIAIFSTFKLAVASTSTGANKAVGGDLYATKLLLTRVGVLAVSQSPPGDLNGGKSSNGGSGGSVLVTVALSQADAERLILAQQVGQLYLGLLSDNSVTAPDGGVTNVAAFKPAPIFVK